MGRGGSAKERHLWLKARYHAEKVAGRKKVPFIRRRSLTRNERMIALPEKAGGRTENGAKRRRAEKGEEDRTDGKKRGRALFYTGASKGIRAWSNVSWAFAERFRAKKRIFGHRKKLLTRRRRKGKRGSGRKSQCRHDESKKKKRSEERKEKCNNSRYGKGPGRLTGHLLSEYLSKRGVKDSRYEEKNSTKGRKVVHRLFRRRGGKKKGFLGGEGVSAEKGVIVHPRCIGASGLRPKNGTGEDAGRERSGGKAGEGANTGKKKVDRVRNLSMTGKALIIERALLFVQRGPPVTIALSRRR